MPSSSPDTPNADSTAFSDTVSVTKSVSPFTLNFHVSLLLYTATLSPALSRCTSKADSPKAIPSLASSPASTEKGPVQDSAVLMVIIRSFTLLTVNEAT